MTMISVGRNLHTHKAEAPTPVRRIAFRDVCVFSKLDHDRNRRRARGGGGSVCMLHLWQGARIVCVRVPMHA